MRCPNCGMDVATNYKAGHTKNGCLVGLLLQTLEDRGHDLRTLGREHDIRREDLEGIDADTLWERFGGPAADWVAEQLGIPAYPKE